MKEDEIRRKRNFIIIMHITQSYGANAAFEINLLIQNEAVFSLFHINDLACLQKIGRELHTSYYMTLDNLLSSKSI